MTLTVLSTDGAALPTTFTVTVPKSGKLVDLTEALSIACSLRDDETLLVAEVFTECSLLHVVGAGGNDNCMSVWMGCMTVILVMWQS